MFTKGKTFLFLVILAGLTVALTLRLTLYSGAASTYSTDSNKQLRGTALGLVKKIRELADSFYKKDRELMADYETNYLSTRTTERQQLRNQYAKNLREANDSTVRAYRERLLSESKTVRAELHKRLPEQLHRPNLSKIYENPSIVLEIQVIADDLELLSKSLPDT
jgi:hypothetical protein